MLGGIILDNLIFSFNVIMPIFLVMAVGYFSKEIRLIDEKFINTAVKFNFRVGLSTLLFYQIYTAKVSKSFDTKLLLFAFFSIIVSVVVLCIIVPIFIKDKKRASAMIHTIYRSNFVLLGIPIGINMMGKSNIEYVALLLPVAIPTYNFLAVLILAAFDENGEVNIKEKIKFTIIGIIKNPLIIASVIAIVMRGYSLNLPMFIDKAVSEVSSMGTPLALITLGAQLEFRNVVKNLRYSLIATLGRLVVLPCIMIIIAILIGFRRNELASLFILFCAPSAVSSYIMAKEMNSDYRLTGDVVILSTFFSMFTIFMGIYILRFFHLI